MLEDIISHLHVAAHSGDGPGEGDTGWDGHTAGQGGTGHDHGGHGEYESVEEVRR